MIHSSSAAVGEGGCGGRARPPAAADPAVRRRGAGEPDGGVLAALFWDGPPVDPPGDAAAGDAAAGVLLDPLGAAADGAVGVRPAVPLVRGAGDRRSGLEPFELLEEPGPAAGRRDRGEVPGGGAGAAAGEAVAVQ